MQRIKFLLEVAIDKAVIEQRDITELQTIYDHLIYIMYEQEKSI